MLSHYSKWMYLCSFSLDLNVPDISYIQSFTVNIFEHKLNPNLTVIQIYQSEGQYTAFSTGLYCKLRWLALTDSNSGHIGTSYPALDNKNEQHRRRHFFILLILQLDLCAFGVMKNQKVGNILENFTTESVMYVFLWFLRVFLYHMFIYVVYFWKQVMRCWEFICERLFWSYFYIYMM